MQCPDCQSSHTVKAGTSQDQQGGNAQGFKRILKAKQSLF